MLVSIQTGTNLESLSQIVGKDLVGTVEMKLPVEKVRPVAELNTIMQTNRMTGFGEASEFARSATW